MNKPCPVCHDTRRMHELRLDAAGRPYRSERTRPCLVCQIPSSPWRRSARPMLLTIERFVDGVRERGYEAEEVETFPRAGRGTVQAELMFGDTLFHGARRWRDPVAGPRVDLRFTRFAEDGTATAILVRYAVHRDRALTWPRRTGELRVGQRVYALSQGRYGRIIRRHRRGVVVQPDGDAGAYRLPLRAVLAAPASS
jgi:hypothetical protein